MPIETITSNGILVVDHATHMLDLVGQMLRALGRRDIRLAQTGEAALIELNRRPFEAMLLDDALADIDAVQLVYRLRRDDNCRNRFVPVIMMSESPGLARITAARDAGINEFLRRPFAANHIETRLRAIQATPRQSITSSDYVGPDRRRRLLNVPDTERRGHSASDD